MWLAVSSFMVMGLVSGLSLANHSDSESFLVVHTLFSQDGCQQEGFLEVVKSVSFLPFPNSSGWWWLVSSVFFTRTSFCKTIYADGYYGAWPGWAVSINVVPLAHLLAKSVAKNLLLIHFISSIVIFIIKYMNIFPTCFLLLLSCYLFLCECDLTLINLKYSCCKKQML